MPLKKNGLVVIASLLAFACGPTAAADAATSTTSSTAAPASCPVVSTSQVFKQFGDSAQYQLAPNGTFQNNAAGWQLSGSATVGPDTNTFGIGGSGDYAITLGPASSATSPPFCVSSKNPYFRFLLKPDFFASSISTAVTLPGLGGVLQALYSWATMSIFPGNWQASAPNPLSTLISLNANGTAMVRLKFTDNTTWETISDVYVDPWAR